MLNTVTLTGRLTADPILQRTANNVPFVNFSLAVERDYKAKDGQRAVVDFIACVVWRKDAESLAKALTKGCPLQVQGRLESSSWTDKKGSGHSSLAVNVEKYWFGETKAAKEARKQQAAMNHE